MLQEVTTRNRAELAKVELKLPTRAILRWTPWRKRSVILAMRAGALTANEASERYMLSHEELAAWSDNFDQHGVAGLMLKCGRRAEL
jgi:hypothetical protein